MNARVQAQLLEINRRFYDQFAASFSVTRDRIQPGVRSLLSRLGNAESILDLGCGNGTLARALAATEFSGRYLGTDMSEGLLREAQFLLGESGHACFSFIRADLTKPGWEQSLLPDRPYDWLTSFAVLHHLPGETLQRHVLQAFAKLMTVGSRAAVSVWQWENSPRLHKHIIPWSEVGLSDSDVDEGDVLLDWRASDRTGIRYVHTYSEDSLRALAESAGLKVLESFYADGKPGNLALYQIWQSTQP